MWMRLETDALNHPDVIRAGRRATMFWLRAIGYAVDHHLASGLIPAEALRYIDPTLASKWSSIWPTIKQRIVGARLCVLAPDGAMIINRFNEFQRVGRLTNTTVSRSGTQREEKKEREERKKVVQRKKEEKAKKEEKTTRHSSEQHARCRFQGRFRVWDWQHDEAKRRLGTDDVWLDDWYRTKDEQLRADNRLVVNDRWDEWLWPELCKEWERLHPKSSPAPSPMWAALDAAKARGYYDK